LKRITQSRKSIKKEITPNHEVFHPIQSVQFKALNIKTYHKIVKISGIIYTVRFKISK
jgi:hypothetical protein